MKKLRWFGLFVVLILTAGMLLGGCGNNADKKTGGTEKKTIKIGVSPTSFPLGDSGVESLEAKGYKVEIVHFDDIFLPNVALNEGTIDATFHQHEDFMITSNKKNGFNIIMLKPKMYKTYTCFYSKKGASIAELPQNGRIAIANDASNIDQYLCLLDEWGVIKLTSKKKELYNLLDIVDNPKNFTFITLDSKQRVAALDELDGIVNGASSMYLAGINPEDNVIYKKYVDNPYWLGFCINANTHKEDDQWVKDMMAAYTSDEAYKYVQDYYKGLYMRAEEWGVK